MKRLMILMLVVGLVAAACGDDEGDAAASDGIKVVSSDLGSFLTDAGGNTLYLFLPDGQGESQCYDGCEQAWPPLTATTSAGAGTDGDLLDTAERTDGTTQVTYNGWPLYYFANDAAPGDTNGQGVNDVWFVVDAAGDAIGMSG